MRYMSRAQAMSFLEAARANQAQFADDLDVLSALGPDTFVLDPSGTRLRFVASVVREMRAEHARMEGMVREYAWLASILYPDDEGFDGP